MLPRLAVALGLVGGALSSCGGVSGDAINTARTNIFNSLKNQSIYERGNLPVDNPPSSEQIKGWFDIVDGTYRWVVNEDRATRLEGAQIERDDSIAFMFDGRIFTSGTFENMQTFYTNIEARIQTLAGNNPTFGGWSTAPLRIKVGDDSQILHSLQGALIGCRAGDGDPSNDNDEGGVASDRVRVFLTSDLAFGSRMVYNVPPGSTLVFEITDIEIIR